MRWPGTGGGTLPYYDIGALERQVMSDPVNLIIEGAGVDVLQVGIGDSVVVNWTVRNNQTTVADGPWTDTVFASRDTTLDLSDTVAGQVEYAGDLAGGAAYDAEVVFAVPPSTAGDLHFLIRTDARQQLRETIETDNGALLSVALDIPQLALFTPSFGQFTARGQSHYYRVTVPPYRTLELTLDSTATSGMNSLYIAEESIPSPTQYGVKSNVAYSPDQQLLLPRTSASTYYILVHSEYGAAAADSYSLTAALPGFKLDGVSPDAVANAGLVTVAVDGSELNPFVEVSLIAEDATTFFPVRTDFVDPTKVYATFDLGGVATGLYDVRVRAEQTIVDQTADQVEVFETLVVLGDEILEDGLTVLAGVGSQLSTQLVLPRAARIGRVFPFELVVANTGDADMISPVLQVASPNGTPISITPNPTAADGNMEQIVLLGAAGRAYLAPGEDVRVTLYALANQEPASEFVVQQVESTQTALDWNALQLSYRNAFPASEWSQTWANFLAMVGDTWADLHDAMRSAPTVEGSTVTSTSSGWWTWTERP